MFYRTDEPHGLPHNPFNALVLPRPIGWISSVDAEGNTNLAPYSFFNGVAYDPPQVMFAASGYHADGGLKDSVRNIQQTGEFVLNLATYGLKDAMNISAVNAPHNVDEFELAGLEKEASELVSVPRVKASPAHLECKYVQTVELLKPEGDGAANLVIFGQVIGVHINDDILTDGLVDMEKADVIGRLGYMDYARVTDTFEMHRPKWPL
ncbi:MAG: flavin reductase family protein [Rhodospirillales bacterium]|jgi:flavin reductase (DIM6/NTAB) family NADH-FMN oxidoreductase RutF|nr:flavin reductase family protein [Rhodospirillales bacterium]